MEVQTRGRAGYNNNEKDQQIWELQATLEEQSRRLTQLQAAYSDPVPLPQESQPQSGQEIVPASSTSIGVYKQEEVERKAALDRVLRRAQALDNSTLGSHEAEDERIIARMNLTTDPEVQRDAAAVPSGEASACSLALREARPASDSPADLKAALGDTERLLTQAREAKEGLGRRVMVLQAAADADVAAKRVLLWRAVDAEQRLKQMQPTTPSAEWAVERQALLERTEAAEERAAQHAREYEEAMRKGDDQAQEISALMAKLQELDVARGQAVAGEEAARRMSGALAEQVEVLRRQVVSVTSGNGSGSSSQQLEEMVVDLQKQMQSSEEMVVSLQRELTSTEDQREALEQEMLASKRASEGSQALTEELTRALELIQEQRLQLEDKTLKAAQLEEERSMLMLESAQQTEQIKQLTKRNVSLQSQVNLHSQEAIRGRTSAQRTASPMGLPFGQVVVPVDRTASPCLTPTESPPFGQTRIITDSRTVSPIAGGTQNLGQFLGRASGSKEPMAFGQQQGLLTLLTPRSAENSAIKAYSGTTTPSSTVPALPYAAVPGQPRVTAVRVRSVSPIRTLSSSTVGSAGAAASNEGLRLRSASPLVLQPSSQPRGLLAAPPAPGPVAIPVPVSVAQPVLKKDIIENTSIPETQAVTADATLWYGSPNIMRLAGDMPLPTPEPTEDGMSMRGDDLESLADGLESGSAWVPQGFDGTNPTGRSMWLLKPWSSRDLPKTQVVDLPQLDIPRRPSTASSA